MLEEPEILPKFFSINADELGKKEENPASKIDPNEFL